jgi:hypothetical protein
MPAVVGEGMLKKLDADIVKLTDPPAFESVVREMEIPPAVSPPPVYSECPRCHGYKFKKSGPVRVVRGVYV